MKMSLRKPPLERFREVGYTGHHGPENASEEAV
jgi:hypothetical protein